MALILNNKQPKILPGKPISVAGPAVLALTSKQPSTKQSKLITVAATNNFILTGKQPSIKQPKVVTIAATTSFTLINNQPKILSGKPISLAGPAVLALTSKQPKILSGKPISVAGPAVFTLTSKEPKVSLNKIIKPGKSDLILSNGQVITKVDHKVATQVATMSLSTESPNVIKNHLQQSGVANLNLSGAPPNINLDITITSGKADIILSNGLPSIFQDLKVHPDKATITMIGDNPTAFLNGPIVGVDSNSGVNFRRLSDMTNNANGKVGLFSGWFNFDNKDTTERLYNANGGGDEFIIGRDNSNNIEIRAKNSNDLIVLWAFSDIISDWDTRGWTHILIAWDLGNSVVQMYIDGVESLGFISQLIDDTIDYTQITHNVLSRDGGLSPFRGCAAEFYLNTAETLDISDITNREKFYVSGSSVDLGSDGSKPTGNQPIIYFSGNAWDISNNIGYGGSFSLASGTFTPCDQTIDNNRIVQPSGINLTLVNKTPIFRRTLEIFPGINTLTLTNKTPSIVSSSSVLPSKTDLVLTNKTPSVVSNHRIIPSKTDLVLTNKTASAASNRRVLPSKTDLTLTNKTPSTVFGHRTLPSKTDLVLTNKTASVNENNVIGTHFTGKAELVLSNKQPTSSIHISPGKTDLVLSNKQPTVAATDKIIATTGKTSLNLAQTNKPFIRGFGIPPIRMVENATGGGGIFKNTALTGVSDGRVGSFSMWYKIDIGAQDKAIFAIGINGSAFPTPNRRLLIYLQGGSGGKFSEFDGFWAISGWNSSGTEIMDVTSNDGGSGYVGSDGLWHHILISWDLTTNTFQFYHDDKQLSTTANISVDDDIEYSGPRIDAYANLGVAAWDIGCGAQLYLNLDTAIDFSVLSNRRDFNSKVSVNVQPVDLGSDGSNPTGIAPTIFLNNPASTPIINSGNGGNFDGIPFGSQVLDCDFCDDPTMTTGKADLVLTNNTPTLLERRTSKANLVLTNKTPVSSIHLSPGKTDLTLDNKQPNAAPDSAIFKPGKADLILDNKQPAERRNFGKADFVLDNKTPKTFFTLRVNPNKNTFTLISKKPFIKVWQPQDENVCIWTEQTEDVCTWTIQTEQNKAWVTKQTSEP